jgi:hypothetical protein
MIMEQLIYMDKIFISGSAAEVIMQLRMLSCRFSTIKELYEYKMQQYLPPIE